MYNLSEENKRWVEETWAKLERKMSIIAERTDIPIPNLDKDGMYVNVPSPSNWVNGFWPGMMLLMYKATGNEIYIKRLLRFLILTR